MASDEPLIHKAIRILLPILLVILLMLLAVPTKASSFYKFPETITVRVTGKKECDHATRYVLEEVPFKDYVKGVLSNEWGMDWHEESLKAGAIAVKMYALYTIENAGDWVDTVVFFDGRWQPTKVLLNGKWIDAHVYDCDYDMVYNPAIRSEKTDQAVDQTWDYVLIDENGEYVQTFFNAWIGGCEEQEEENCAGQWNTLEDAENGMTWEEIISKYYNGDLINLRNKCHNCPVDVVIYFDPYILPPLKYMR